LGISLSHSDDAGLVRLDGVIDISVAEELKNVLTRAIADGRRLRIAVEGVTGLDVTAWQLLLAARREARQKGIGCTLENKLAESVERFLGSVGLPGLGTPEEGAASAVNEHTTNLIG
jgi:anti-anti-sigma factor